MGISAFLDDGIGLSDALVQVPGRALRIEKDEFQSLAASIRAYRSV